MEGHKNIGEKLIDHFSETENQSTRPDREIEEWLNSSAENRNAYRDYKKMWAGISLLAKMKQFEPKQAWQKVNSQLTDTRKTNRQLRLFRYAVAGMAASILLLLSFAFYIHLFSLSSDQIQVATARGSRSEMVLPDGTRVKLNAGSALQYRVNKFRKTREIQFQGEAYFEVAKNRFPFVVHSKQGMTLKVLGTRFNYSDYDDGPEIKTTLIEGKVELNNGLGNSLIMVPGQIVSFDKKSKQMVLVKENPLHPCGWMEDKLYMENMSLDAICLHLERRYDVRISLHPSSLGSDTHYTGVLQEETIATALDALCELSGIQYDISGREIQITKK
ncbi:MAG: FecR domain-containing protein [Prolixibacteraceae bacterium]|jgi:ferric-dicitrate binding protein FerR (iron transport regulator)|nr:FecR domain-containing protein [Prolixibacteraceae bacterium]